MGATNLGQGLPGMKGAGQGPAQPASSFPGAQVIWDAIQPAPGQSPWEQHQALSAQAREQPPLQAMQTLSHSPLLPVVAGSTSNVPQATRPDAAAIAKFGQEWADLVAQRQTAAGPRGSGDTTAIDAAMDQLHAKMVHDTVSRQGITAYHGSHADFNKFSDEFIGTGEGAQAYSYGHYAAENENVAKSYKPADLLNPRPVVNQAGEKIGYLPGWVAGELDKGTATPTEYINMYKDKLAEAQKGMWSGPNQTGVHWVNDQKVQEFQGLIDTLTKFDRAEAWLAPGGKMYQIAIHANASDFLDWDKPLSQQSPKVQEALIKAGYDPNALGGQTGAELYRSLVQKVLGEYPGATKGAMPPAGANPEADASKLLKDAGIAGVRYLDAGSRGAGAGTHNYVVYDPAIIEIIKKYGLAALIGGAGALSKQAQAQPGMKGAGQGTTIVWDEKK